MFQRIFMLGGICLAALSVFSLLHTGVAFGLSAAMDALLSYYERFRNALTLPLDWMLEQVVLPRLEQWFGPITVHGHWRDIVLIGAMQLLSVLNLMGWRFSVALAVNALAGLVIVLAGGFVSGLFALDTALNSAHVVACAVAMLALFTMVRAVAGAFLNHRHASSALAQLAANFRWRRGLFIGAAVFIVLTYGYALTLYGRFRIDVVILALAFFILHSVYWLVEGYKELVHFPQHREFQRRSSAVGKWLESGHTQLGLGMLLGTLGALALVVANAGLSELGL